MSWKFWDKKETPVVENSAALENIKRVAAFLADRQEVDRVKAILVDLVERTNYLTKQDIANWRRAWQQAISVEYPNRSLLYALFRDIAIDTHVMGLKGQITNEILQKAFKIVDRNSEANEFPKCQKQLQDAQWFKDFCYFVIDSEFNGYNLVQFGDIITVNGVKKFEGVEFVEREHVIPEHHVFVKNVGDHWKNGFDYTQPPYSDWCIGLGNPKDLGLYNVLAPHALAKKNMLAFWDKFGEIFGAPMRIGKTSSSNPKDRNDITEMLSKMGNAAWGLFPDGTEIEIKETTRGDAWQVYDKRIERANSEMSKAVLNQTMSIDSGSSKAQGNVHLSVQQKVVERIAIKVRVAINSQLIPFLIRHGFDGWDNALFKYDDFKEYTITEQLAIEEMILKNYDVDPSYFTKKYNIDLKHKTEYDSPKAAFDRRERSKNVARQEREKANTLYTSIINKADKGSGNDGSKSDFNGKKTPLERLEILEETSKILGLEGGSPIDIDSFVDGYLRL